MPGPPVNYFKLPARVRDGPQNGGRGNLRLDHHAPRQLARGQGPNHSLPEHGSHPFAQCVRIRTNGIPDSAADPTRFRSYRPYKIALKIMAHSKENPPVVMKTLEFRSPLLSVSITGSTRPGYLRHLKII